MDVSVINKLMKIFDKNIFQYSSDLTIPAIIPNGDWFCLFPISWFASSINGWRHVLHDGDLQRSKKICIIVIGLSLSINQIELTLSHYPFTSLYFKNGLYLLRLVMYQQGAQYKTRWYND